jgi:tRNA A37 threonylcarbamoyladenosine synthetase subunit TsaC/SUA5/YrdC
MAPGDRAEHKTTVGSLRDAASLRLAATLIKERAPVGAYVRAVCAIFIDASQPDAVEAIYRIKGERRMGRPISTLFSAPDFVRLIDPDEVSAELRSVVLDPRELEARFGSLGFIRAPIRDGAAAALPASALSKTADGRYWLQNYIHADSSVADLFVKEMLAHGVGLPAATSMNVSGQPEITEQDEGVAFCAAQGIPFFLADAQDSGRVRGSFPIVSIERTGLRLVREGHFPGYLVPYQFGAGVDISHAMPAKYPLLPTHTEEAARDVSPHRLHNEIVARLDGTVDALDTGKPARVSLPARLG